MTELTWSSLIHGGPGIGKSWLGDTSPAPRLILDAEGGTEWTPSHPKQLWLPNRHAPPGVEGCEPGHEILAPTTRVMIRDYADLSTVYQWLNSGQHFFKSMVADTLDEIQKRCKDTIAGAQGFTQQDWGTLLSNIDGLVRNFRDLRFHPTNPMSIFILAHTDIIRGAQRPALQGAISKSLPGYFDSEGYMYTEIDPNTNALQRKILWAPVPGFEAKDRTNTLPSVVSSVADENGIQRGPDIRAMMEVMKEALAARHQGGVV